MSERDDLDEHQRDLEALFASMPPETQKALDANQRLNASTHLALLRMLALRRGLAWLTAINIVLLAVQIFLAWERFG